MCYCRVIFASLSYMLLARITVTLYGCYHVCEFGQDLASIKLIDSSNAHGPPLSKLCNFRASGQRRSPTNDVSLQFQPDILLFDNWTSSSGSMQGAVAEHLWRSCPEMLSSMVTALKNPFNCLIMIWLSWSHVTEQRDGSQWACLHSWEPEVSRVHKMVALLQNCDKGSSQHKHTVVFRKTPVQIFWQLASSEQSFDLCFTTSQAGGPRWQDILRVPQRRVSTQRS
jgi:hypothetical protein